MGIGDNWAGTTPSRRGHRPRITRHCHSAWRECQPRADRQQLRIGTHAQRQTLLFLRRRGGCSWPSASCRGGGNYCCRAPGRRPSRIAGLRPSGFIKPHCPASELNGVTVHEGAGPLTDMLGVDCFWMEGGSQSRSAHDAVRQVVQFHRRQKRVETVQSHTSRANLLRGQAGAGLQAVCHLRRNDKSQIEQK